MVCSEMALAVGCIYGTVCYFHNHCIWYWCSLPVLKDVSFAGAVLSRLEVPGIVNARFLPVFKLT